MAKLIDIKDVGTESSYRLDGTKLEMLVSGGCEDALNDHGCVLDEALPDYEIRRRVYASWIKGYEGDPEANELRISVYYDDYDEG